MTQLTPVQENLLRAAAEGEGAFAAARTWKTVAALVSKGLLISTPVAEGGAHTAITAAGRHAIGLEAAGTADDAGPGAGGTEAADDRSFSDLAASAASPPSRPKGKIGVLVAMLREADGATIEAMTEATGWQAHSVRGAISGSVKKTLGLTVISEKIDGVRLYRIVKVAA